MLYNFNDNKHITSAHNHYEGRYGYFQSYDNHHAVINHLKSVAHDSAPRAYRRVKIRSVMPIGINFLEMYAYYLHFYFIL